ncbi:MAG: hypothetical protein DDT32_00421 [Syntrophomonadaceae bacterium]|nr:hypothetical protein [Bacillota bacterium]
MKILQGRQVRNFEEATLLAFEEAGRNDMSLDIGRLFASVMDIEKLQVEGEKSIKSAVRGRYGRNVTWSDKRYFIPVPYLHFNTEPVPQLTITVQTYLVSSIRAETKYYTHSLTLVAAINKREQLSMPMIFLWTLLKNDLGRFRVIARSGDYTTWDVPGVKGVRFPHDFLSRLSVVLNRKSVLSWLEDFGSQGRSVAPLVVGCLLGLQFMDAARALPAEEQTWDQEMIIGFLVDHLGCSLGEAREMFARAGPDLRADQKMEDVIRAVLQRAREGGTR